MPDEASTTDLLMLTSEVVAAHVANNRIHSSELPSLIKGVYDALSGLGAVVAVDKTEEKPAGAVTARKSLGNPAHILSMIDGKPYKMLRRHIGRHGHTPESYREAYGLATDYPMVAPAYTELRRSFAHEIGLGRKRTPVAAAPAALPEVKATARRGRKPRAAPADTIAE